MLSSFGFGRAVIVFLVLWMVSAVQAMPLTIDTISAWETTGPPRDSVGTFGYPGVSPSPSETFGETFIAPSVDNVLTSFSLVVSLPSTTTFKGYVYAWTGTMATGSPLFVSAAVNTPDAAYETIEFDIPGGLQLTSGVSYVLFASTHSLGGSGSGRFGGVGGGGAYSDGQFVFLNQGDFTSNVWNTDNPLGRGGDLAFEATFTGQWNSVPEPSFLALIGAAMVGMQTVLRRRRK